MNRILYLSPGPTPYPKDPNRNIFFHLSKYFEGDVLSPIWGKKSNDSIALIKKIDLAMDKFNYHVTFSFNIPPLIKTLWDISFYLLKGLKIYKSNKYNIIVTYGFLKTGIAGILLKILTGAKLIIEVPGNPKKIYIFDKQNPSLLDILKNRTINMLIPYIIRKADHLKLLYPNQLENYNIKIKRNCISIFHDFVPISTIKPSNLKDENFILFVGFPWYLKGVDILIKAFLLISDEFPKYRLKIIGFCPNKKYFEDLAKGNNKIELHGAVSNEHVIKLMKKCTLFILPSRTEAMGRVLLEAMACKKPIIASKVDGIPFYIKHGFNGLLFESENIYDLANKMRIILRDSNYARKLAQNGYVLVNKQLSEKSYVANYKKMIDKVLNNNRY